ncbi:MAG: hypothetical protein QM679_01720 [Patulibacter sp.]
MASTIERDAFYRAICEYLKSANRDVAPELIEGIDPTDNLWDLGFLDSFGMVKLLTFLEEFVGREIVLSPDSIRTFHTIERMYDGHVARDSGKQPA